jgi:hypothetical protein
LKAYDVSTRQVVAIHTQPREKRFKKAPLVWERSGAVMRHESEATVTLHPSAADSWHTHVAMVPFQGLGCEYSSARSP